MLWSILMFAAVGILFMGIAIPLINHRVKRNWWYGFRTPKTLSSDRIWYAANEHSGRMLFVSGFATMASAFLLAPIGAISLEAYVSACTFVMIGFLLFTTYLSFKFLRRL
jgi:uncharacterized membrane protein